jgi:hypothetical protein
VFVFLSNCTDVMEGKPAIESLINSIANKNLLIHLATVATSHHLPDGIFRHRYSGWFH